MEFGVEAQGQAKYRASGTDCVKGLILEPNSDCIADLNPKYFG